MQQTYLPKIQNRLNVHCRRYGIQNDRVSFLNLRSVKIRCDKRVPPTHHSARALIGFIPYGFRVQEGLHDRAFGFKFEDGYCIITFAKAGRKPRRQKRLEDYLVKYKETTTAEFISETRVRVPYGRMKPSPFTTAVLLRRVPYKFRMLEKLCSCKVDFEFKTDGFCYITFKK